MPARPRIVWPTTGFPALLENGERQWTALIEHHETDREALQRWADGLTLRDRLGRVTLSLRTISIGAAENSGNGERVAAGSATESFEAMERLAFAGDGRSARIRFEAVGDIEPASPRAVRTFDLCDAGEVVRPNAIAAVAPGRELRLIFASDLHIAAMWEEVNAAIARHAPELVTVAHHPSHLLRDMVEQANQLAARGELDLVVLGGDLVDHVYSRPREEVERGERAANVDLLLAIISELQVPTVVIPGNHDYRLHPWRLRSYSLGSINLSSAQQQRFLRAAGLWGWSPILPSDVGAIRTEAPYHVSLVQHRRALAPVTDFTVALRRMTLVFANSGRDIVPRWRELERQRWTLLARSLPGSWVDPDSEGLSANQLTMIERALDEAQPTALFVHAPLLHARGRAARSVDLSPGDNEDDNRFEHRLFASGLRNGVISRNSARLVRALLEHRGPTTMLSGHVHHDTAFTLERRSRTATMTQLGTVGDVLEEIPLLTTPSLGHRRTAGAERPGYLLITFRDGALHHVERRSVSEWRAEP